FSPSCKVAATSEAASLLEKPVLVGDCFAGGGVARAGSRGAIAGAGDSSSRGGGATGGAVTGAVAIGGSQIKCGANGGPGNGRNRHCRIRLGGRYGRGHGQGRRWPFAGDQDRAHCNRSGKQSGEGSEEARAERLLALSGRSGAMRGSNRAIEPELCPKLRHAL